MEKKEKASFVALIKTWIVINVDTGSGGSMNLTRLLSTFNLPQEKKQMSTPLLILDSTNDGRDDTHVAGVLTSCHSALNQTPVMLYSIML